MIDMRAAGEGSEGDAGTVARLFYREQLYSAVRIIHLHQERVPAGWSFGNDRHYMLEFKYCARGSLNMRIDGAEYGLQAGDAVLIKPGIYHHTEPTRAEAEFFVFHFDIESEQAHQAFQMLASPLLPPSVMNETDHSVQALIEQFLREFGGVLAKERSEGSMSVLEHSFVLLRAQARLLELIGMLGEAIVRHAEQTFTTPADCYPSQMNLARDAAYYMEQRLPASVRIGELAAYLGVHRSYLSDCFRQTYGMSPQHYWNVLRIRRAKQLLQDTPYTIEDIAQKTGFSSSAHFCRFFRQNVGQTPGKFRNRAGL